VKAETESVPERAVLLDHQMGKLGVELLTKATLCAIGFALIAGMAAALLGS
jgi:hypothetical protein